jgi:hypothetical protein
MQELFLNTSKAAKAESIIDKVLRRENLPLGYLMN